MRGPSWCGRAVQVVTVCCSCFRRWNNRRRRLLRRRRLYQTGATIEVAFLFYFILLAPLGLEILLFFAKKYLEVCIGRDLGALKGLYNPKSVGKNVVSFFLRCAYFCFV